MKKKKSYIPLLIALTAVLMLTAACSTKKNTPMTRFYHSMTAHYNTLYNGEVAFQKAQDAQIEGHKDNYNRLLPMYISTTKATADMGKASYAKAIEKCEKAIKLHSIKRKPATKPGAKRTKERKDYLARKEFNPYLWRAWLLMGRSQFGRGEFIEAASTFNYMVRLYATQPEIANLARTWLARCYVALDWPYDAEDVLRKMAKDSLSVSLRGSYNNSRTAWLIQTGQYEEAIPLLRQTIGAQKGSVQRARLNFLLGQLCRETGSKEEAYAALKKVLRANPPYEMSLNARVMQSEMASRTQMKQMIKKLKRMAKNDNNKNYIDQIYLAIGNIYLNNNDTLQCTYAWEKGLLESKGGSAKGTLLLRLANLYWEQENYIDAARCYKECISALEKESEEMHTVELRNKALEGLPAPLQTIKLQDSLQLMAKLPPEELEAACERLAKEYTKKEKEEAKRKERAGADGAGKNTGEDVTATSLTSTSATDADGVGGTNRGWYFSNPRTVAQGKAAFFRKWGKRKNADLWRWADKTAMADIVELPEDALAQNTEDLSENDSTDIYGEEMEAEEDTMQNDPHNKAFYLKQIPLTEEQMQMSHQLLSEALFQAGALEQDRLANFPLAHKTLTRFLADYPEHEKAGEACYRMFLICGRMGMGPESLYFRERVMGDFPDSKYASLLANPRYDLIARGGKHLEDSIYAAAYEAYLGKDYEHVEKEYVFSSENFPEGKHRGRFMFIYAMSQLYSDNQDGFLTSLQELLEKYSTEEVAKIAEEILKGVKEGRLLQQGQWDTSMLWARRGGVSGAESTAEADTLRQDRLGNFAFVLAYPTGALDENQLLFEVARYNFTAYTLRNFELELSDLDGISLLAVKGFLSFDEVHSYAQSLYANRHMATILEGIRSLLILEENLALLGSKYSFEDYRLFYEEHFAPMQIPEELRIDSTLPFRGEDEVPDLSDEDGDGARGDDDPDKAVGQEEDAEDFPFGF